MKKVLLAVWLVLGIAAVGGASVMTVYPAHAGGGGGGGK